MDDGDAGAVPAAAVEGVLERSAVELDGVLRALDGWAERLGGLGLPVAQVYAKAAETSLSQAVAAVRRSACSPLAMPRRRRPDSLDPCLLEWLE